MMHIMPNRSKTEVFARRYGGSRHEDWPTTCPPCQEGAHTPQGFEAASVSDHRRPTGSQQCAMTGQLAALAVSPETAEWRFDTGWHLVLYDSRNLFGRNREPPS